MLTHATLSVRNARLGIHIFSFVHKLLSGIPNEWSVGRHAALEWRLQVFRTSVQPREIVPASIHASIVNAQPGSAESNSISHNYGVPLKGYCLAWWCPLHLKIVFMFRNPALGILLPQTLQLQNCLCLTMLFLTSCSGLCSFSFSTVYWPRF